MELLDFRKVHLGGHQNTGDVALHVVLLGYTGAKQTVLVLESRIFLRGRPTTYGFIIALHDLLKKNKVIFTSICTQITPV